MLKLFLQQRLALAHLLLPLLHGNDRFLLLSYGGALALDLALMLKERSLKLRALGLRAGQLLLDMLSVRLLRRQTLLGVLNLLLQGLDELLLLLAVKDSAVELLLGLLVLGRRLGALRLQRRHLVAQRLDLDTLRRRRLMQMNEQFS